MLTSHSPDVHVARCRAHYWLWGNLPADWAAQLIESGYIVYELEDKWDKEFETEVQA